MEPVNTADRMILDAWHGFWVSVLVFLVVLGVAKSLRDEEDFILLITLAGGLIYLGLVHYLLSLWLNDPFFSFNIEIKIFQVIGWIGGTLLLWGFLKIRRLY